MFGIPTFDLLTDRGKQEFIQYIINLMRNEIIIFTSNYNVSTNTLVQNIPDNLLVNAHMLGINVLRPNAGDVTPGTYYTSTDISGGTTYRSNGRMWEQIAGAVQGGVAGYYGSFYDNTDQPLAAINTAQIVEINSTYGSNGVSVVNDQITFDNPGTYQLTYVIQITNDANSIEEAYFWIRFNGTDYANSSTEVSLPARKSVGNPSSTLVTVCLTGTTTTAGDYVELWWWGSSTDLTLSEQPAQTTPVVTPETPSVIVSVIQVMNTQAGPTGPTGPTGTAATINAGTTTTNTAGTNATVVNSGTTSAAIFDFGIPGSPTVNVGTTTTNAAGTNASVTSSGTQYAQVLDFGIPGSATVNVGTTSTLSPGSSATVNNSGTQYAAVLDFGIPEGPAATINVGTTTTGAPGSNATVVNSGTSSAAVFDFTIPQGAAGVGNPPGAIIAFGGTALPSDYLWCDGSLVSKTTYAGLYAVLGANRYGTDTSTDFYLPDLRDRFPRGATTTASNVTSTNINSHTHTLNAFNASTNLNATTATFTGTAGNITGGTHNHNNNATNTSSDGQHNHSVNGGSTVSGGGNHNHSISAGGTTAVNGSNANRATGNAGVALSSHSHNYGGASTNNDGSHNHSNNGTNTSSAGGHNHSVNGGSTVDSPAGTSGNHNHSFTPSGNVTVTTGTASTTITTGTNVVEDHIPAHVGVNYIIKT